DRNLLPHDGTYAAKEFRFGIVEMFRDHRAMQIEVDRVHRDLAGQFSDDFTDDPLERIVGDHAPGAATGPDEWKQFDIWTTCSQEPGECVRAPFEGFNDLLAPHEWRAIPVLEEIGEVGAVVREGMAFVLKACDSDANEVRHDFRLGPALVE